MSRQRPDRPNAASGLRLFVAAPLPPDVVARATALVIRLAGHGRSVRWADPRRLHLTLAFLGAAVPRELVPAIAAAIDEVCRRQPPVAVACGGLGRFPAAGRLRVVWLGVTHGEAELVRLQDAIAGGLEPLGFPREARAWQPHITLGRLAPHPPSAASASLMAAIAREADCDAGRGVIGEIVLYKSERMAAGPAYRRLHTSPLGRA